MAPAGQAAAALERCFRAVAAGPGSAPAVLAVEGREIPAQRLAEGVAWFGFDVLCGGPRGTGEYIEIARCHHTVILSDVPVLGRDDSDAARRFINLVDELYDRNVNLVLSAAAEPEDLYQGERRRGPSCAPRRFVRCVNDYLPARTSRLSGVAASAPSQCQCPSRLSRVSAGAVDACPELL